MTTFWKALGDAAVDGARAARDDAVGRLYGNGFNDAANVCVELLTERSDHLMGRIRAGALLTDAEQHVLAELSELKAEMERRLFAFEPGQE